MPYRLWRAAALAVPTTVTGPDALPGADTGCALSCIAEATMPPYPLRLRPTSVILTSGPTLTDQPLACRGPRPDASGLHPSETAGVSRSAQAGMLALCLPISTDI